MLKLNNKGFTLIEALIAVVVLIVGIVGLMTLQATFARGTADRTLHNSLVDAASSALTRCQTVTATTSPLTFTYEGNLTVTVTLNASCSPAANTCNTVTATATAQGKSFNLTTQVCNFT